MEISHYPDDNSVLVYFDPFCSATFRYNRTMTLVYDSDWVTEDTLFDELARLGVTDTGTCTEKYVLFSHLTIAIYEFSSDEPYEQFRRFMVI